MTDIHELVTAENESLKAAPEFAVGDPVWVHVDDVNSPTGWWQAEVTSIEYKHGYPWYAVKLTDLRLQAREEHEGPKWMGRKFYERSPSVNYHVFPRNKHTDDLVRTIESLETTKKSERHAHEIREQTLIKALVEVKKAMGVPAEEG